MKPLCALLAVLALTACLKPKPRSERAPYAPAPNAASAGVDDRRADESGRDERRRDETVPSDAERRDGGDASRGYEPPAPIEDRGGGDPSEIIIFGPGASGDALTQGDCHKASAEACAIEREIVRLVNELRAQRGRPQMRGSKALGYVARDWSVVQAQRGRIGHDGFPAQRTALFRAEFPVARQIRIRGENVALAGRLPAAQVAQRLFSQWAASEGHLRNMLGNYGALGVGVAEGSRGWYGTQIFGETDQ